MTRRGLIWWLGALLAGCWTARPAAAAPLEPGPRVTLHAADQPLGEVLTSLAKQLNRRFVGSYVASPVRLQQRVSLDLDDQPASRALAALQTATRTQCQRVTRGAYSLEATGRAPATALVQALGEWDVVLSYVRFYFYSTFYPGDPERTTVAATLAPYCLIRAPHDLALARVVQLENLTAETAAGETLTPANSASLSPGREGQDTSVWPVLANLPAPPAAVRSLRWLRFDLRHAAELRQARAVLEWDATAPVTAGDYTFTLTPTEGRGGNPARRLVVRGPVSTTLPPAAVTGVLQRGGWLEARLLDEAGNPLPGEARLESQRAAQGTFEASWSLARVPSGWVGAAAVEAAPAPRRVEVELALPEGLGEVRTITFTDVPLPPREQEALP